jgi:hypothetical protein
MASFNSQRNKFFTIYDWTHFNQQNINLQQNIQNSNQKSLINAKKSITNLSINRNLSTNWITLTPYGTVGKDVYYSFDIEIQNIPEKFIDVIKAEPIIRSLDGTKTLLATAFYKVITYEIEDIQNSDNKNLRISISLEMRGQDVVEGWQVKLLCYIYPLLETVK